MGNLPHMRLCRRAMLTAALLACLLPLGLLAQALPDSSFGTNGWVQVSASHFDECVEMALLPDGRVISLFLATDLDSSGADSDMLLACHDSLGFPDPGFGTASQVRMDFGGRPSSSPVDLAVHPSGRIALLGSAYDPLAPGESLFHILVLDATGKPDSSFGVAGQLSISFMGPRNIPTAIAWQADGKLLVAGASFDTAYVHKELPVLARLLPEGAPDSSFGGTGKLVYSVPDGVTPLRMHSGGGYINDLFVEDSGRILCAGALSNGTNDQCWMLALTAGGLPDSTFSADGVAGFDLAPGFTNAVTHIHRVPGGRYALTLHEECPWLGDHFYTAWFDPGTDAADIVEAEWADGSSRIWDAAMDDAGSLILAGDRSYPDHPAAAWPGDELAAVKLQGNTIPDAAFGSGGRWSFAPAPDLGGARAVLCLPGGRVLLAGTRYTSSADASDGFLLMLQTHSSVGIASPMSVTPQVYPNPFDDSIFIGSSGDLAEPYWLMNAAGTILQSGVIQGRHVIDAAGLPAGMYCLRIGEKVYRLVKP